MFKLEYYQKKFNLFKISQGSDDWLDGRQYCIGGSEMSTVLGKNKYDTWEKLMQTKAGKHFDATDATEWGHLFEQVAKHYIRKEYGTIYEFGSIPHCLYPVCYSPDGIIVENDHLVLLEIKSPIYRGVHKIPEPYLYQVYTGMNIIHVKYTLFVQCRFRRCKYGTNPHSTIYDRKYHIEYRKRCKDAFPLSWGYLYWDCPGPLQDLAELKDMCPAILQSKVNPSIHIEDKTFNPTHGKVLMWKLFEINYSTIKPKKFFLDHMSDFLWTKYKQLREGRKHEPEKLIEEQVVKMNLKNLKPDIKEDEEQKVDVSSLESYFFTPITNKIPS